MTNSASRLVFALALLAFLVSCGSNAVGGDEMVLIGTVYLQCGKTCREHGSCGKSDETGRDVILIGAEPAFPGVSAVPFMGLTAKSAVEIVDTKVVAGVEQRSNQEVEIRFYAVKDPGGDTAGWVPGFCIANMEQ